MNARKLGALAGAATLVLGLAACGDDDESASTGTTQAEETTTTGAEATTTSTPDEEGGEGEEGGAPDVNPCAPGESGVLAPPTPPADDATDLEVIGVDYEFRGLEALTATGEYSLSFENQGAELHELILVKLADEETPLEELVAGDTEPEMEEIAFTFACPGATAEPTAASVAEPGRYVAICFIPTGAFPDTPVEELDGSEAPPHFAQGMVQEILIEA